MADMLHLCAICILMYRIRKSRNCIGKCPISSFIFCVRTFVQDPGNLSHSVLYEIHGPLHVLHFSLQHLDETFLHFFDSFHCLSYEIQEAILHSKQPFLLISLQTYDSMGDDFPHLKVLLPAAFVLTCIVQSGWTAWELTWSFSLWLEALAFLPQIVMLNKIRIVENITSHYVACLGLYRFLYILNWVYRYQTEGFVCWTQILSGTLQTGLYVDFLYWYYISMKEGKSVIELPI